MTLGIIRYTEVVVLKLRFLFGTKAESDDNMKNKNHRSKAYNKEKQKIIQHNLYW